MRGHHDLKEGTVKSAAAWVYLATVPLCLSAPFVRDEGLRGLLFTYFAVPLCGVSLVLALTTWLLAGKTYWDLVVAIVWAMAAVSMSMPLSAAPQHLEVLFVVLKVQAGLVGAGAVALLVNAIRAARRPGPLAFRAVYAAGLAVLALFLARRSLGAYASFFVSESPGLATIAAEIRLFWRVVAACAAAIALGAIGLYASRARVTDGASLAG